MNMREEFEKWYQIQDGALEVKELRDIFKLDEYGEYYFLGTRLGWRAWQAAWQAAQPKWIKCSDKNPSSSRTVLCYGQYGDDDIDDEEYRFIGYRNSKGIWYSLADGVETRARVTHWMPLPNPPEE